jgi:hypothetical protein
MRKALITLLVTACAAPLLAAPSQRELGAGTKQVITVKVLISKTVTPIAGSTLTKTGGSLVLSVTMR